jgi:hypothetical protein
MRNRTPLAFVANAMRDLHVVHRVAVFVVVFVIYWDDVINARRHRTLPIRSVFYWFFAELTHPVVALSDLINRYCIGLWQPFFSSPCRVLAVSRLAASFPQTVAAVFRDLPILRFAYFK